MESVIDSKVSSIPVMGSVPDTGGASSSHSKGTSTPIPDLDALPDVEIVLRRATHANQRGNDLFAAHKIEEALLQYQLALQIASQVPSTDFCSLVYVSRAVCFCNLGRYVDAIKESTKALELNPSYIRALQSRAEAHHRRYDIDAATADVKKILVLDPSNEYAGKQIRRLGLLLSWKQKSATWFLDQPKLKNYRKVMLGIVQMMEASTVRNVEDPNTGSDCPVRTMQQ